MENNEKHSNALIQVEVINGFSTIMWKLGGNQTSPDHAYCPTDD